MKEIIIATTNEHKVKECNKILKNYNVLSLKDVGLAGIDIIEDGDTFEENALIKARTIRDMLHKTVIADDSGLEIEYLNNEPGIRSARFMGHDTSYTIKNKKILEMMKDVSDRRARFVCAIAIAYKDGSDDVFRGVFEGEIAHEIRGENGFGYDPIFYVPEYGQTASEMPQDLKNVISHRAKAIKELFKHIKEED